MRQRDKQAPRSAEETVRDIRRATRWQVSAEENIPALEAALEANAEATVLELEGLNHLFQNAETGAVSEYARIEETFSPEAIDLIIAWILNQS